MYNVNPDEKAWIIIKDGKSVKNHGITITALAKVMQDVQKAYDNIGQSKYGDDYNKEDFQLYIKDILPGSVALPFYPQTFGPRLSDAPDPFRNVTKCFENLIETVNTNPDGFKEQLEKEVSDPSNRLGLLKSMHSLTRNDSRIILKISDKQPKTGPTFDKKNTPIFKNLLHTYTTPSEMTINGIMLGFHAEKEYYFTLKTENDRSVRCYFDEKDADKYQSYFWKWVTVKGKGVTTQKNYYLTTVTDIAETGTVSFKTIGDYELSKPIEFKTSYEKDDKLWGMVCEELAIYGYGSTYRQTLASLEEEIENLVICFNKYTDKEMTDESPVIKKRLQNYLDLKETYAHIVKKYGDAK